MHMHTHTYISPFCPMWLSSCASSGVEEERMLSKQQRPAGAEVPKPQALPSMAQISPQFLPGMRYFQLNDEAQYLWSLMNV